ncbi:MAG: ABC transporter permease [Chloroflexota bacterium]|nr:ABC transporter permease [Chloroflexota bacterium]
MVDMTAAAERFFTRERVGDWLRKYLIIFILVGVVALLAIATGGRFLQPQNLINVVRQMTPIALLAIGLTVVIISTGIDLSVGSIVALSAVVATSLAQAPGATNQMYPDLALPVIAPIAAGLLVGAACGFVNGVFIAGFRIPPFIATLGMMTAARGLALMYSGGRPISTLTPEFNILGQGVLLGIPVPIILLAIVAVGAHLMLNKTRFGRHVFALGGNEQAARVSGINLRRVKIAIYVFSGLLAGLAGMVVAGRIGSGNPQLGTGAELDAIASAVIGGTSFSGGIGTIWGTIVGALLIGSINTGLDLLNVSPFAQQVVKGVIIVAAIIIDERKRR